MKPPIAERFWAKVEKRGPRECWPWTGARASKDGRGRFSVNGRNRLAPRVAWALTNGCDPVGCVCHSCDNPSCVNPAHLWVGTVRDNNLDMFAKGRAHGNRLAERTHCPHGHAYTPENTLVSTARGYTERSCRECHRKDCRLRQRAKRAARRAAREAAHA
jgi:hypothetical protein